MSDAHRRARRLARHARTPIIRDLQHHFDTLEQQHEAATLGMWLFLVTEVMFFGGLFMAYLLYRVWYPEAWAEGSRELDIVLGGVQHRRADRQQLDDGAGGARRADRQAAARPSSGCFCTMALGLTFLVVKFFEYKDKFEHHHVPGPNFHFEGPQAGPAQIFFSLYFPMTGLHALHMIIGFVIMA